MTFLLPSEHLDGTAAERQQLRDQLQARRTTAAPAPLPGITFRTLPQLLAAGTVDADLFSTGYELMAVRYSAAGARALLPLERVWVGIHSTAAPGTARSHGGFHHPGQGYRHLQMDATITAYGDLTGQDAPASAQAIALDLLRAYAHDCLHFGTFRRYRLGLHGEAARTQYGINFRRINGVTYSAPDLPNARITRNLGILMEAATDTEATAITRQAADLHGLTTMCRPGGMTECAFADLTNQLGEAGIHTASRTPSPYLRSLSGFTRTITSRYRALLADLAETPDELHRLFVTAMISGDLDHVNAWLDARHGRGTFAQRFRTPSYAHDTFRSAA